MLINQVKIGHVQHIEQQTGLTVFLMEQPSPCSVWICGAAPAMREVSLLDPTATVSTIDALVFTGGSAFGLDAAQGVMQWLREHERGFPTKFGRVPIVPTAAIYDFSARGAFAPTAADAYVACQQADANLTAGLIGAGCGATVGKLSASSTPMTGGFGYAQISTEFGLEITACVVVNAVGNVLDADGNIIAGAVQANGEFANFNQQAQLDTLSIQPLSTHNTTLVALFTNGTFDKAALARIARMASAGMARALVPVFTNYDGDVVFAIAHGTTYFDEVTVGTLAARAVQEAIISAVQGSRRIK